MDRRHRSRAVLAARLLATAAVVVVGLGLALGGWALAGAAVAAAGATVGAAVATGRLDRSARVDMAQQRVTLDQELDRRLDRAHEAHDGVVTVLQSRLRQADRDRGQLQLALEMAIVRRSADPDPGSRVHGLHVDGVRGDVPGVRLDRAS